MYLVMIDVPRYNITACPLQIDQICRNLTKVAKVQVCDNFLRHYLENIWTYLANLNTTQEIFIDVYVQILNK